MLIAATAVGCATPPTAWPSLVLRVADGWVWVDSEQMDRFQCDRGLLTCDDAGGRLSRRRCRCLE
jgi:hypothetical protein